MKLPSLVLTGGGARAAYQAGAVRALAEIWPQRRSPFRIITGISAGSINACLLAHYQDDFLEGAEKLWSLWNTLTIDRVFATDGFSMLRLSTFVLRDLILGGFTRRPVASHLLDTSPLKKLISDNVDFDRVRSHLTTGSMHAFCVTATNYHTGCAVTFYEAPDTVNEWVRNNHLGWRTPVGADHILASASIPIFFPAVPLDGGVFYGDGTVRLLTPLSPALHMGAQSVLAIGVRKPKDPSRLVEQNHKPGNAISFADVAGTVLNAVFLDTLESDMSRLRRFNRTLHGMDPKAREHLQQSWRVVEAEILQPSRDLGIGAGAQSERYPWLLRHLLRGLGVDRKRGTDVSSYIAFDYHYTSKLLRIGYNDVMDRRDVLRKFMLDHADA